MKLDDYARLKDQHETLQREADRIEGKRDLLLKQLADEFGCSTIAHAERMLEREAKELSKLKKKLTADARTFETEYGDLL